MTFSTSSRPKADPSASCCGSASSPVPAVRRSPDVTATRSRLKVAAPPIGGRANSQCVEFVADLLGVRKSQVEIVSGEKSRLKRVRVADIDPDRARDAIAQELRSATARPGSHDRTEQAGSVETVRSATCSWRLVAGTAIVGHPRRDRRDRWCQ